MFKNNKELAVLESKFQIYEELSKEMLDKLERAVATISENSNRISLILERHEFRLNEVDKNDQAIMKLIEKIEDKMDNLESKVDGVTRFRWLVVGVAIAITTVIQSRDVFIDMLTPDVSGSRVEIIRE
jgi:septation ring formation regulator EzrA